MLSVSPYILPKHDAYSPLFDQLSNILMPAADLAAHWGYTENHLANLRNAQKGLPHVKLPTGAVRYRLSEILAAEIRGTSGPLTLERVETAIMTCKGVPEDHRAAMLAHLRKVLAPES